MDFFQDSTKSLAEINKGSVYQKPHHCELSGHDPIFNPCVTEIMMCFEVTIHAGKDFVYVCKFVHIATCTLA